MVEQELRKTLADARKALGKGKDKGNAKLVERIEGLLEALRTAGQKAADQAVIRRPPVPSGQVPPTQKQAAGDL